MKVLEIKNLSKNYGNIKAVNDLSLSIEKGCVFGILGPNGSGKTTTLGMILGIIKKDAGDYKWFGDSSNKNHRKKIGAILETPNFYPYMNAENNLKIISQIKGTGNQDYESILKRVNLWDRRSSKFRSYSLGMKQRLAIGATLVGNPEVVIFDEPTNGLDPQGIAEIRNILTSIADEGKTVIMASHILDEVEKVCSHVAIIKNGNLLATGAIGSFAKNKFIEINSTNRSNLKEDLNNMEGVTIIKEQNAFIQCEVSDTYNIEDFSRYLTSKNHVITHLLMQKRSLEEEFLEIVK